MASLVKAVIPADTVIVSYLRVDVYIFVQILLKTALPALSSTEITEHKAKFDPKEAIKELAMLIKDNPELAREMNGVLNPPKPRLVVENA